jgi:drug/metabolite transporter (DMT)-like permease
VIPVNSTWLQSPYLLLIAATLFWGGNFVLGKAAIGEIPPFTLAFFRWITALVILLPFTWKGLKSDYPILLQHWKSVILMSITGVVGFNTITYMALQYTTSINASLVNAFSPIIIAIFSFMLIKEKLKSIQWLGVGFSFLGLLMIVSNGSWEVVKELEFNPGDLLMILAISSWGLYSVIVKKMAGTLPSLSTFTATVIIGLIPMGFLFFLDQLAERTVAWSLPVIGILSYVALFASIASFLSWNKAVSIIGPSVASVFLNLIPIFAAILALLFLGESLSWYHLAGAALTGIGVYTVAFYRREKKGKK